MRFSADLRIRKIVAVQRQGDISRELCADSVGHHVGDVSLGDGVRSALHGMRRNEDERPLVFFLENARRAVQKGGAAAPAAFKRIDLPYAQDAAVSGRAVFRPRRKGGIGSKTPDGDHDGKNAVQEKNFQFAAESVHRAIILPVCRC